MPTKPDGINLIDSKKLKYPLKKYIQKFKIQKIATKKSEVAWACLEFKLNFFNIGIKIKPPPKPK